MAQRGRGIVALALALALVSCRPQPQVQFFAEGQPEQLSQWRLLTVQDQRVRLNSGVLPYDLNTPLFSDYASKLRTVWMPQGRAARYRVDEAFEFPIGTIISKTFYYALPAGKRWDGASVARQAPVDAGLQDETLDLRRVRLIETRLLVRREQGWLALPYVWNETQTDAVLQRAGALVSLELIDAQERREPVAYQVPDQNQCAGCHATDNRSRRIAPIGLKARHLNRDFDYADGRENQLLRLSRAGYLTGAPAASEAPRAADWTDAAHASLDDRARAYLDINCGHCHSATGPALTSGMSLDAATHDRLKLGFCKQPIAAGKGTGGRLHGIVPGDPDASILAFRMDSDEPAVMMPELGRSVIHREGVALIREWIAAQPGTCDS
ncbi:MAG TPA: SO2930 family diheme c-type cytochrome [Pseudoxanthomonas sp.]|nr:SO2930 family diheme c-type cytochrome [Pseudoxanthomonas sp.]